MGHSSKDNELLAVHISRRDLAELIDVLRKAEELCENMRSNAHDFRMHRVRLELLRNASIPPPIEPERRESTRYLTADDLRLGRKKEEG